VRDTGANTGRKRGKLDGGASRNAKKHGVFFTFRKKRGKTAYGGEGEGEKRIMTLDGGGT